MPLKRRRPTPPPVDDGVGLPNLFPAELRPGAKAVGSGLGMITRLGSGVLSAPGGWVGAGVSGGGEALAEFLEGSLDKKHTAARIGTEAGLGLIPFGKVASGTRALIAGGKVGAMSGGGDVGRQWAEGNFEPGGEGLDKGRTALATLLGIATGGLYNKLNPGTPPPKAPPSIVVESSGAVPRGGPAPTGLSVRPPKNDIPSSKVDYTDPDQAGIATGGSTLSAARNLPATSNYGGGVSEVHGLPVPTSQSTVLSGPRKLEPLTEDLDVIENLGVTAGSRVYPPGGAILEGYTPRQVGELPTPAPVGARQPYNVPDEESGLIADLEAAFGRAMNTADTRFDALQKSDAALKASKEIEATKAGLQKQSPTVTETVKAPGQTKTTRYKTADEDDENVDALNQLLGGASTPEAAEQITQAARRSSGRVQELLSNLDEEGIKTFNYYVNKEGLSDIQAYRKAFYDQGVRRSRIRVPVGQKPENPVQKLAETITPKVVPPTPDMDQLKAVTHPSFYDEGFGGLENAADAAQRRATAPPSFYDEGFEGLDDAVSKTPPPPSGPPKGSPAAAKFAHAETTYQPEVMDELKKASAIYNNPNASREAKKAAGKELARLRDFMEGKGKFAPKAEGAASTPDWVAEQSSVVDKLNALKGEKGFQNIEAMLSTAFGAGGALTGAAVDASQGDDSVWDGLFAGLGIGALAPQIPGVLVKLSQSVDPTNVEQVRDVARKFVAKLPQVQRFSLLLNPQGVEPEKLMATGNPVNAVPALAANALGGPYGAVLMRAVEDILKQDPRGWKLLQLAYNPAKFAKGWWDSAEEARIALLRGEQGRAENLGRLDPNSTLDQALLYPGQAMTMGDIYARKLMSLAGYSDAEAKLSTLTSEPDLFRGLSNVAKNNPLVQLMFPFRRTPVNILEQGIDRIPGVGQAIRFAAGRPQLAANDQVIQGGLGLGVGGLNYAVSSAIEDDATRRNWRRISTNMGGRYSLPAMLGAIAGDANARGLTGVGSIVNEQNAKNIFPLPATDVITDTITKGANVVRGDVDSWDDFVPTSMSLRPLRQWLGDRMPELRDELQVQPPPSRGLRRRTARRER